MRTQSMSRRGVGLALGLALGSAPAFGLVQIESFDNYTTGGNVASFAATSTVITPGATDWTVDVQGGGFGFHFDDTGNTPNGIDITGETVLEVDFSVNAGGDFGTTVIVVLEDKNGLQSVYDFGALQGNFAAGFSGTASTPLTLPGGFDTTGLNFFHVQANSFDSTVDPVPYSVTFSDLRVVPEPASAALVSLGAGLVGLRRRRA